MEERKNKNSSADRDQSRDENLRENEQSTYGAKEQRVSDDTEEIDEDTDLEEEDELVEEDLDDLDLDDEPDTNRSSSDDERDITV